MDHRSAALTFQASVQINASIKDLSSVRLKTPESANAATLMSAPENKNVHHQILTKMQSIYSARMRRHAAGKSLWPAIKNRPLNSTQQLTLQSLEVFVIISSNSLKMLHGEVNYR